VLSGVIAGRDLSYDEAQAAMAVIMSGDASAAQIAGFLVGLRSKGETVDEMAGLVSAMRAAAVSVDAGDDVVDLVGTGGDGLSTFNISTTGALIAAGAGVKMAKHGNRAASSKCGAADVLEALGLNLEAEPKVVVRMINESGFGFFFAPRYHPSMRHAGPVRRELGVPTVFNFLGPLANPANARRQATGVGVPAMAEKMVGVLDRLGSDRSMVFVGDGGMDELTLSGPSQVWQLHEGAVAKFEVSPTDLGLSEAPVEAVVGGLPEENRQILVSVLKGAVGPTRDIAVLNAAAAIWVSGMDDDLAAAVQRAQESVDSGRAHDVLQKAIDLSHS
jgi:anthranilate phosphoribosyltransferase